tara:strand:+ start:39 stop:437 length:399 start_codon:yes stop_codon:yes gene_type:complete
MNNTNTQSIKEQIAELNDNYTNGNITRKNYLSMFSKIKNSNSVSNQVKRFGAKVIKEIGGYYIYNGVNFTAKFNIEHCVSSVWQVDIYSEDANAVIVSHFDCNGDYENTFDTKKDLLWALLNIDKEFNLKKY